MVISYHFLYTATHLGLIAQLVERIHGMDEVSGSIPLESTLRLASLAQCKHIDYYNRYGFTLSEARRAESKGR